MTAVFDVFADSPSTRVVKCEGLHLYLEGNEKVLDMSAGGTSHMILGWNHPQINNAIKEQLSKFSHVDYKIWRDSNVENLSELIVNQSPKILDSVYFCGNSGAEACEAAMRMSFLVHKAEGRSEKIRFIGRTQSYHGASLDAMSLTDRPNLLVHQPSFPDNKLFVTEHNPSRHKKIDESDADYVTRCLSEIEACIEQTGADTIAGFIGETIMGGLVGDVPPSPGYWTGVRALCNKYQIHLILDEVYCGTGTTGKYHCFEYDDVEPDFLMLSKTLAAGYAPLSALVTKSEYKDIIHKHYNGRLAHSTTMQAYSLGVAAGLAVQTIICEESFLAEVYRKGEKFRSLLQAGLSNHCHFSNVRGRGLRFSLEHDHHEQVEFSNRIMKGMFDRGIYLNSKWHKSGFTPSLYITDEQIEFVADNFIEVFKGSR